MLGGFSGTPYNFAHRKRICGSWETIDIFEEKRKHAQLPRQTNPIRRFDFLLHEEQSTAFA
jgi:hypothetical protein